MDRIQVRSLLNNNIYNSNRKYKVNDVVIHNSIVYQNVTGKQGEPGSNNNWIQIKINLDDVVTRYGTQDIPGLKKFTAKCEFQNGLKLDTDGVLEIGYNELGAFFVKEFGVELFVVGENFVILGDYTGNKGVRLMYENVAALRDVKFQNKNGTISYMNDTGWAQYTDTVYTSASPLAISSGNTITIDNNANTIINSQIPSDTTSLYDAVNNKITPTNIGDAYNINIRFKAKTSVVNDYLQVGIDIGGTQGIIVNETVPFLRGANTEQSFNFVFPIYSLSTFVSNGGLPKITAFNGNLQVYNIIYVITRTHKAY